MANEGERLRELEVGFKSHREDYMSTKADHETRIRSIEKTIWMAFGVFSLLNSGLFIGGLAIIAKMLAPHS